MDRRPASTVRGATEGGLWAAAAVVAAQWAAAQYPEVRGVDVLAASAVGGFGAWFHSVVRNIGVASSNPVVRAALGVRE